MYDSGLVAEQTPSTEQSRAETEDIENRIDINNLKSESSAANGMRVSNFVILSSITNKQSGEIVSYLY